MPHPGVGFPIPPFQWPHVGRQWPSYNVESDQADGLVMWMPWGGGYPASHRHIDTVRGLVFTEAGTPVWVADSQRGWSLQFDAASSEYLEHPQAIVLAPPFTLAAWVNLTQLPSAYGDELTIFSISKAGNNWDWISVRADDATDAVQFNMRGPDPAAPVGLTGGAITANTWEHYCAVAAATDDRRLFLNGGGKVTSGVAAAPAGMTVTNIGVARLGAPQNYLDGRLGDMRIYNRALADAQVEQLVTQPWELYQIPQRLWRLGAIAPPLTIVPVAMHHYRSMRL